MPSLAERIKTQSLPGYEAAGNPTVATPPILPGAALPGNKYIRCPLPPFSANSDTLRQYNEGGAVPTRRVIPLPTSVREGSGTQIINTTVTGNSGGSSAGGSTSGGTTGTIKAATITFNVPALSPLGTFQTTIIMAKSFQLLQMNSSAPLEVRLYGSNLSRAVDIARLSDTAPPFEINGIITDVIFDTAPYQWNWQNRIAANADSPQSTTIYVTVVNPSPTTGTGLATASILYLPLEA
jgi:hypothetical protein